MAKRKKLKNIQISNQELTPTTIGYLDSKQKGPFLLLIIFAILFATLYYMPELTEYLSGKKVPMDNNPSGTVYDDEGKIFIFNNETLITVNSIEFSKINVDNNKLSILANNTKDKVTYLDDYYIELYDKNDTLLERISLSDESLNKYGKRTYTYDIANQEDANKISISVISNNELPETELRLDGSMQVLTCTNTEITYVYNFTENSLKNATFEINQNITDFADESAYQSALQSYRYLASGTIKEGISNELVTDESSFSFTKKVDLSMASANDIDDEMFYTLDESASKVAFQNSLKKYKCY